MVFAVAGGTGTIGSLIADRLRRQGSTVRVLNRGSADHHIDVVTGAGLEPALVGVDVLIDALNGPPNRPEPVLVAGSRRLYEAAARAGISHVVCVSIVGIERVPTRYYRAKLAQERELREAGVPFSIVRSTQFHEFMEQGFAAPARLRLSPRSRAPLQPIAASEAAERVAEVALGEPLGHTVAVTGPRAETLSELARAYRRHRAQTMAPVPVPWLPRVGRALAAGGLLCEAADHRGTTTFEQWLTSRV